MNRKSAPSRSKGSVLLRACLTGLLLALLTVVAWPADRGGWFSLTVVSGHSMEPTYHTGDMLITVRQSSYAIGDVVVYDVADGDVRGRVVHRITKQLPNGNFLTRGDNNNHGDPWEVRPDWIRGEAVFLLPQGYRFFGLLRLPIVWAVLCGMLVTAALWPRESKRGSQQDSAEASVEDSPDELSLRELSPEYEVASPSAD